MSEEPPVFDEPWQAQALALVEQLKLAGVFSPNEWADTLGAERARQETAGEPDTNAAYYMAVVVALEQLSDSHAGLSEQDRSARKDAWRRAYLNTPHGAPVHLSAGQE